MTVSRRTKRAEYYCRWSLPGPGTLKCFYMKIDGTYWRESKVGSFRRGIFLFWKTDDGFFTRKSDAFGSVCCFFMGFVIGWWRISCSEACPDLNTFFCSSIIFIWLKIFYNFTFPINKYELTSSLDYSWVAKVINIARPHLPETKTYQGVIQKGAGPEISTKTNVMIKNHNNVHFEFHSDRKAKIRIPELSSDLLSFKAFLQNQVSFPSNSDRKNQPWTSPKSLRQV